MAGGLDSKKTSFELFGSKGQSAPDNEGNGGPEKQSLEELQQWSGGERHLEALGQVTRVPLLRQESRGKRDSKFHDNGPQ